MRILSNHAFPGDESHEVRCFSGECHDYACFNNQRPCYFKDILEKMPQGWEPEFVMFKSPMYFAVPYGIEDCPYPTVLLLDDWFGGVDYLPDTFAKFDFIFTDKTSEAMLRRLGFCNVEYWPLFPFSPVQFRLIPDEQRVYDVTFTGNFNVNVQGTRLPWLRRLVNLDKKYKVRLFHQAWNEEYLRILNRSKIVFNRSIKSEMNQRAFEAPACGAMLFMEDSNLEVRDFFTPGKECVLFNDGNFEELLLHYLTHEDERAAIARQGYQRVQNFSIPALFGRFVDKVKSLRLEKGRGRCGIRTYASFPAHRDFVQTSLAKYGRGESTVKNVSILISDPRADSLVLNDSAVVLMTYADDLKATGDSVDRAKIISQCLALLAVAERKMPGHLTPAFNRAQMLLAVGNVTDASDIFRRLFSSTPPEAYELCKGLVYPLHYVNPLRYEWSMAIAEALPDSCAMARARHLCIRFFCAASLAAISQGKEHPDFDESRRWYESADSLMPKNPHVVLALARLYMKRKHVLARQTCEDALSVNPFCIDFWKEWARYLADGETGKDAVRFVESCLLCLGRLQFATPQAIDWFETLKDELSAKIA